jgi:hypothetical protein
MQIRKALRVWGNLLLLIGLGWFVFAITAPFAIWHTELTFENFIAFAGYGAISLSVLGFIIFAVGSIPIALGTWIFNAWAKRRE